MINWLNLAAHSLWILGCALALATLSFSSWEASLLHIGLRERLQEVKTRLALDVAGALFCLGRAGISDVTWQVVIWGVLALAFLGALIVEMRSVA